MKAESFHLDPCSKPEVVERAGGAFRIRVHTSDGTSAVRHWPNRVASHPSLIRRRGPITQQPSRWLTGCLRLKA